MGRTSPDACAARGTDTAEVVPVSRLEFAPGMAEHCVQYQPSAPDTLDTLVRMAGVDPSEFALVDIGSGKGRMVLCASAMDFRRAVGMEYSALLHAIALRNAAAFAARGGNRITPEFHCADATRCELPVEQPFIYFYHPFGPPLIESFIDRVEASMARQPRRIIFAYTNPLHREAFDDRSAWQPIVEVEGAVIYELACDLGAMAKPGAEPA